MAIAPPRRRMCGDSRRPLAGAPPRRRSTTRRSSAAAARPPALTAGAAAGGRRRARVAGGLAAALLLATLQATVGQSAQLLKRSGFGVLGEVSQSDGGSEYFSALRKDYKFRIQEKYVRYTVDLLIDPCRDKVRAGSKGENCCAGANIAGCQHHADVEGGPDMQIAFFHNAHVPNCRGTPFEDDPNCGTFIEVHRPGNRNVLADVQVDNVEFPSGYQTVFVATNNLCLGYYELWWVVRNPAAGPFVLRTRRFYVTKPSCPVPDGAVQAPEFNLPKPAIP